MVNLLELSWYIWEAIFDNHALYIDCYLRISAYLAS
jgi:hypothetical protein